MGSSSFEKEVERQLTEYGKKLLDPPSEVDLLLHRLDKLEQILMLVGQAPPVSMREALQPALEGLTATRILKHPDESVQVSVASCFLEIMRITAPDPPYRDPEMKDFFKLIIVAIEKLPHVYSQGYAKAVSILDSAATYKSFLIMLDLELDELVAKMFDLFFRNIRSNHPNNVFSAMEKIMTMMIEESDDIPVGLLNPLLESLKRDNQYLSPLSWKLGENVIGNCATKLKPYLRKAVKSTGTSLDDFAEIIAQIYGTKVHKPNSIGISGKEGNVNLLDKKTDTNELSEQECDKMKKRTGTNEEPSQAEPPTNHVCPKDVEQAVGSTLSASTSGESNGDRSPGLNETSLKGLKHCHTKHPKGTEVQGHAGTSNKKCKDTVKSKTEPESIPKKRDRKPNSLMNPEEGYEHFWVPAGSKSAKSRHYRKSCGKESNISLKVLGPEEARMPSKHEKATTDTQFAAKSSENVANSLSPSDPIASGKQRKKGKLKKMTSPISPAADPNSVPLSRKDKLVKKVSDLLSPSNQVSCGRQHKRGRPKKFEKLTTPDAGPILESCSRDNTLKKDPMGSVKVGAYEKDEDDRGFIFTFKERRCSTEKNISETGQGAASTMANAKKGTQVFLSPDKNLKQKSSLGNSKKPVIATDSDRTKTSYHKKVTFKDAVSPKKGIKRKRFAREEALDDRLVGERIKVWWPDDELFYEGVVGSFDPRKKKHRVLYGDGDVELLNLKKEQWKLISDNVSPSYVGDHVDLQTINASFFRVPTRKRKFKPAKEVGPSSGRLDRPRVDQLETKTSKEAAVLGNDDVKSAEKLQIKMSCKYEQSRSETGTDSKSDIRSNGEETPTDASTPASRTQCLYYVKVRQHAKKFSSNMNL